MSRCCKPDSSTRCEAEKAKARAARDYLKALLERATRIDLVDAERGKYFRIVATVQADGVDVAVVLIQEGLARSYEGGSRDSWCP